MSNFTYKSQEDFIIAENLTFVTQLNLGDGYGWSVMEVYYKSNNRRFYWLSDSGCSCNFLWEDAVFSLAELEDGSKLNAVNALRSFGSGSSDPYDIQSTIEACANVMSF